MTNFALESYLPSGVILRLRAGANLRLELSFTFLGMKSSGKRGYREEALESYWPGLSW